MVNSSFMQLPQNLGDAVQLRRFLDKLMLQLDIAFGNRGNSQFSEDSKVSSDIKSIQDTLDYIAEEEKKYTLVDGTKAFTGIVSYDTDKPFTDSKELIAKKYVDDNFTKNTQQPAISDLNQVIGDPPTQGEVQAISDKIDTILAALRNSNIIT